MLINSLTKSTNTRINSNF